MHSPSCLFATAFLLGLSEPALSQQRSPARSGTVDILVALVVEELQVRPVPLLSIEVWALSDTGTKVQMRTGLDGRTRHTASAGRYRLRSAQTRVVGGKVYSWAIDFQLELGKTTHLELTNANAQVDSAPRVTASLGRERAPEIALYERLKGGVLQVQAGLSSGTGFVLDTLDGVVITNAHVIEGTEEVSVVLDSTTRVPAQVLAKNAEVDLAVLRLPPSACQRCVRLRIARPDSNGAFVVPGERVIAIGFPLSQRSTVTAGIVSAVRERAVISDVNINEGNSGGPLVNINGEVVGINTFGDVSQRGGPGLGGSILIEQLLPLLQTAQQAAARLPLPDEVRLPLLTGPAYPLAALKAVAETASFDNYRKFDDLRFGDFMVGTATTLSKFVTYRQFEETIARDRRKREARAGLPEEQRYSQFGEFRDWLEYVGNVLTPAVTLQVLPRAGETSGSSWGRALAALGGAYNQRAKYEFKGDVQAVRWFRNGEPLPAVIGGRTSQVVYENNQWVVMQDVAYRGVYVFSPEAFAPDSAGAPPSMVLQIDDLKHYDRFILRELPASLVARIWNDFQPYFEAVHPNVRFVVADPALFNSDFSRLCARSYLCSGAESVNRSKP